MREAAPPNTAAPCRTARTSRLRVDWKRVRDNRREIAAYAVFAALCNSATGDVSERGATNQEAGDFALRQGA